jgi:Sortase domain
VAPPLPAPPAQVAIVKLGVRAAVVPVLASYGQLDVPTNPKRLGWWNASAQVGAPAGTLVIDGHVDAAGFGPGALFRLADLHTADRISVTSTTGHRQDYAVIGRRVYVKAGGLPPELFATTGPPRLVLITCGGPFDRTTRNYLDNIVIYATPILASNS